MLRSAAMSDLVNRHSGKGEVPGWATITCIGIQGCSGLMSPRPPPRIAYQLFMATDVAQENPIGPGWGSEGEAVEFARAMDREFKSSMTPYAPAEHREVPEDLLSLSESLRDYDSLHMFRIVGSRFFAAVTSGGESHHGEGGSPVDAMLSALCMPCRHHPIPLIEHEEDG